MIYLGLGYKIAEIMNLFIMNLSILLITNNELAKYLEGPRTGKSTPGINISCPVPWKIAGRALDLGSLNQEKPDIIRYLPAKSGIFRSGFDWQD